jgi:hypothetical protein
VRLSYIDFNADDAGNTSDASDVIDGSASEKGSSFETKSARLGENR